MTQSTATALPEGNPTLVLFDIVGSTQHLRSLGSTAYTQQQQHPFFDLCERLRQEHAGQQYGSHQGDALLYVFQSPENALLFSDSLLISLRDHPLEAQDPVSGTIHRVQIRLAVHKALQEMRLNERGDYGYHPDVVYTARLLKIALDDQILLSDTAVGALDQKRFLCEKYPNRRIRDWEEGPHIVYERLWDGVSKGEPGSQFLPGWFRQRNRYVLRTHLENAIIEAFRERTPDGSLYRLVTLVGFGGMGKTRLAMQCAANLAALFGDAMHLVELGDLFTENDNLRERRTTEGTTLRALLAERIGKACGLTGVPALAANLSQTLPRGMRLIIVDNYESVNCDEAAKLLFELLEVNPELYLLVTGREALEADDVEKQFHIESLTPDEARSLFVQRTRQKRDLVAGPLSDADHRAIERILKYTERIPLALELAAARTKQRSLTQIADGLERAPLGPETETPQRHRRLDPSERHKSLTKSLNWSYALLSPTAQTVLARLGLFVDSFDADAVGKACNVTDPQTQLDELLEASLLSRSEDSSHHSLYTMLRPTRAYAGEKLRELSDAAAVREQFVSYYLGLVEEHGGRGNLDNDFHRGFLQSQWRNALAAAQLAEELQYHDEIFTMVDQLFPFIDRQAYWTESEPFYQWVLAIREKELGAEHQDTATSLNNLAALYEGQGKYLMAKPLYQRALAVREKVLGAEHQDTVTSLNNLAALYISQGNYAEAETLYQRALAICEKVLGAEHPDTATSLSGMALLYYSYGNFAAAEPLYRRALEISEKVFGEEHPETATSLNNLAGLYYRLGNFAAAEPLLKRALKIKEIMLGEEHPDIVTNLNNLAILYYSQGNYATSELLYQRALRICEKVLGGAHPGTATSLNSLAVLYDSQGIYSAAEPLYQQALAIREKVLGAEHPDTAASLNNLAYLYISQGNYAIAEPLFKRALAIDVKVPGAKHPSTKIVRKNYKRAQVGNRPRRS